VYETRSALSGRIRVIDGVRERRLIVAGDTLSVMPLDGDWSRVRDEYWWHALAMVPLPPRPSVLLIGLGGGTQIHLLGKLAQPRAISVIERDPAILRIARDWFGLAAIGGVEYLCGNAESVIPSLAGARRRFDYIMEDAAYADEPERSRGLALSAASLVAPGGVLVLNRHLRTDAAGLVTLMRSRFARVTQRRVRRGGENVLICCAVPANATAVVGGLSG